LLLGLVYLLVTILLMVGPYQTLLLLGLEPGQIARSPWVYAGLLLGLVGAGLTVRWILWLGQRAFDRLEF